MKQNELKPASGSTHHRKRMGRGYGSGHGAYSGRGMKGQKARSGHRMRPGFEGGQTALSKKLPQKRCFTNPFKVVYTIVNLTALNVFAPNTEVTSEVLLKSGLVKSPKQPLKILGQGDLDRPLVVVANHFSQTAEKKIIAAGGKATRL